MAPAKSPAPANTPMPNKQGTLSFTASKRTASSAGLGKAKKSIQSKPSPAIRKATSVSHGSSEDSDVPSTQITSESEDDIQTTEQSEESEKAGHAALIATNKALGEKKRRSAAAAAAGILRSEDDHGSSQAEKLKNKRSDLQQKDPSLVKHYAIIRAKMGHQQPIHGEGQNKIHEILRVFDLSYEYGPCIGVTRLERWERASALGLNPPIEVRDILSTRQGADQGEFSQCVYYGEI